jgi:hypothetical protein
VPGRPTGRLPEPASSGPEQAIGSAGNWGKWAADRDSFAEAAEAFGYGLQALEQLFRAQATRRHKETWLRDTQENLRTSRARPRENRRRGWGICAWSVAGESCCRKRYSGTVQRWNDWRKWSGPTFRSAMSPAVSRWNKLSRTGDRRQ